MPLCAIMFLSFLFAFRVMIYATWGYSESPHPGAFFSYIFILITKLRLITVVMSNDFRKLIKRLYEHTFCITGNC